jgi:hypothetical protein
MELDGCGGNGKSSVYDVDCQAEVELEL